MRSVLVVDDDKLIIDVITAFLDANGFKVMGAQSVNEAELVLRKYPVELVITDLVLPVRKGFDLILELKHKYPEVRIIAISGGGEISGIDMLRKALSLGADRAISKPILLDNLLSAIKDLLHHNPVNEKSVKEYKIQFC